jgi:hypothetical protein
MIRLCSARITWVVGHLEQEAVLAFANCGLKAADGLELIGPEKAKS